MKNYCIDTNAILDICYRYYPKNYFPKIWESISLAVIARQIKFFITHHIYEEALGKIQQFGYDETVFNEFLQDFQINIIALDKYEQELALLKADIANANPNLVKLKALIGKDQDLSNTCVMRDKGVVITCEQGLNINLDSPKCGKNFKIPDTCRYFNVPCETWLPLLSYIGCFSKDQ